MAIVRTLIAGIIIYAVIWGISLLNWVIYRGYIMPAVEAGLPIRFRDWIFLGFATGEWWAFVFPAVPGIILLCVALYEKYH